MSGTLYTTSEVSHCNYPFSWLGVPSLQNNPQPLTRPHNSTRERAIRKRWAFDIGDLLEHVLDDVVSTQCQSNYSSTTSMY